METTRAWSEAKKGTPSLGEIKFLQEIVKDAKIEVKDAMRKNVILTNFRDMDHID